MRETDDQVKLRHLKALADKWTWYAVSENDRPVMKWSAAGEAINEILDGDVVHCPAVVNIAGEHFGCDWPSDRYGIHEGWGHTNAEAQAVWQ